MKPEVLVLDEPIMMLDQGRKEVMDTVVKLNREESLTVVLITFYGGSCACRSVLVMENGLIVLEGSPREIFSQVKQLKDLRLDVPPMMELRNLLVKGGLNLPRDILTVEEMVVALCR